MILQGRHPDQYLLSPPGPRSVGWEPPLEENMRLILNVIWLIFGGLWLALGYFLAGILCFILIVTIPFGFAAFRIGVYALWPFGQTVVDKPGARPGAAGRQRHLARPVRHLAGDRARRHRDRHGGHDHRHPAWRMANLKLIPVSLLSARQGDRADDPGGRSRDRHRARRAIGAPSLRRRPCGAPTDGPLLDTFGRAATDLRVSLTDRCNLRCTYCMPAEGLDWLPGDELLRADELSRLLTIAVTRLGITNVRFTGGEPLVSRNLEGAIAAADVAAAAPADGGHHQRNRAGPARRRTQGRRSRPGERLPGHHGRRTLRPHHPSRPPR